MNWLIIGILSRYLSEFSVRNSRMKRKIGAQMVLSRGKGFTSKTPHGTSCAKEMKVSNLAKTIDLKDVEYFKCHKKGYYANK